MAVTAAQIAQMRRLVNEPTATAYTEGVLSEYIARYPMLDERGEKPYTWETTTSPPTQEANDDWIPTYDLAAAAADIWSEKAATLAEDFDTNADGASLSRSQAYEQAMKQARHWRSRRSMTTITLVVEPRPLAQDVLNT